MGYRTRRGAPTSRHIHSLHRWAGRSLAEMAVVLACLAVLTSVAIPYLHSPMAPQDAAQATAERLARHMRLARTLAVLHASDSPDGFALVFTGPATNRYAEYTVVDQTDGRQLPQVGRVSTHVYGATVTCNSTVKAIEYHFSPRGDVDILDVAGSKTHGDPILEVTGGGAVYNIHITEGTGHVELANGSAS